MATFVLCHGGWGGGWIWRTVPDRLRARSHRVFTPTLTGMGERVHLAHPDIDLDTHITDIVNVFRYEELQDVILVGFSYGGMVITGAADRIPERIAQLVYLDAYLPKDGQAVSDIADPEEKAQFVAAAEKYGDGWKIPYISDRGKQADWRNTPQPLKTVFQPVTLRNPAALALPRSYIYCPKDKEVMRGGTPIRKAAQVVKSDATFHYYELQTDHHPMEKMPQELTALLVSIAANAEG